jgi:hypothetical protein
MDSLGQPTTEGRRHGRRPKQAVGCCQQCNSKHKSDQPRSERLWGVGREARQDVEQLQTGRRTDNPRPTDAGIRHHETNDKHSSDRGPCVEGEQRAEGHQHNASDQ